MSVCLIATGKRNATSQRQIARCGSQVNSIGVEMTMTPATGISWAAGGACIEVFNLCDKSISYALRACFKLSSYTCFRRQVKSDPIMESGCETSVWQPDKCLATLSAMG